MEQDIKDDIKARKSRQYQAKRHYMKVNWSDIGSDKASETLPAVESSTSHKAALVGRIGIMMLSCGTGAWRVRESMNMVSRTLGISCTADIGLTNINLTVYDSSHHYSQCLSLPSTGINTDKLNQMEKFIYEFPKKASTLTAREIHSELDEIQAAPANYRAISLALAAALACGGFTFLLGGGLVEVICAFIGAGFGQFLRTTLARRHLTLFGVIALSVALACAVYVGSIKVMESLFHVSQAREAGYICSMLFIIPGFPLITGGIDIAKQDMRSGIERLTYAWMMIIIATITGMAAAYILHFEPSSFVKMDLNPWIHALLRIVASFAGVYGFSYLYNSPRKMAFAAAIFGMFANTLRLELIDWCSMPAGLAAYIGALASGLMAGIVERYTGYPRIALTVPSIVIMVPGLFMYQGVYFFEMGDVGSGAAAFAKVLIIVLALPLGLITARILQDRNFRRNV